MIGYFKPLRRKFGVLMLAMTCIIAMGWLRSLLVIDEFVLIIGPKTDWYAVGVHSIDQQISIVSVKYKTQPAPFPESRLVWQAQPALAGRQTRDEAFIWRWYWNGFGVADNSDVSFPVRIKAWNAPYWVVILPLTLLSAYLLLSKTRLKSTPLEIDRG